MNFVILDKILKYCENVDAILFLTDINKKYYNKNKLCEIFKNFIKNNISMRFKVTENKIDFGSINYNIFTNISKEEEEEEEKEEEEEEKDNSNIDFNIYDGIINNENFIDKCYSINAHQYQQVKYPSNNRNYKNNKNYKIKYKYNIVNKFVSKYIRFNNDKIINFMVSFGEKIPDYIKDLNPVINIYINNSNNKLNLYLYKFHDIEIKIFSDKLKLTKKLFAFKKYPYDDKQNKCRIYIKLYPKNISKIIQEYNKLSSELFFGYNLAEIM